MKRKPHTPQAEFIRLWNAADTSSEVAEIVGRPVETVRRRASNLRRSGHELKIMRKDMDVDRLRLVAAEPERFRASHEHFVLCWQRSLTLREVIRQTGLTSGQARQKARMLRSMGVRLKRFKRRALRVKLVAASRLDSRSLSPNSYFREER